MFVKPFRYERAGSLAEAAAALRSLQGGARVVAGGQSLLPMMNLGLVDVEALIDISHVPEARGVTEDDGYLRVGALTRHRDVERDALLAQHQPLVPAAARKVGSARVRNRGTLGGSLAHSDPAAELPLAMTALGAQYDITNGEATRTVPADEFHVTYFTTQLEEDELIASVRIPKLGPGWGWGFLEVSRRPGDFAIVAAAVLVRTAGRSIVESRVALGGASERPVRLGAVESAVSGARIEDLDGRIGPIEGLEPVTDTSATGDHRKHLARVLTIRALSDACRRAEGAA
ncbi:MAG: xanthine dehydrogenase family protein subunit M [Actinomycetota bacterium]|nr:xanthine dehydrogenase family protein subunit M [Actinomycetota bacterium]